MREEFWTSPNFHRNQYTFFVCLNVLAGILPYNFMPNDESNENIKGAIGKTTLNPPKLGLKCCFSKMYICHAFQ